MAETLEIIADVVPSGKDDGSWIIRTKGADGEREVFVKHSDAVQLVQLFQQSFFDRSPKAGQSPNYPRFQLRSVAIAHGQSETALLLDTEEMGSFVLAFEPPLDNQIKLEVERCALANAERKKATN